MYSTFEMPSSSDKKLSVSLFVNFLNGSIHLTFLNKLKQVSH